MACLKAELYGAGKKQDTAEMDIKYMFKGR